MPTESVQALTSLGFSELEAQIYSFLLGESPVTGYRVAQAVGKPAANTYKAIESLHNKGAVIVEDGPTRMCRPVHPGELVSQIERGFRDRSRQALRALAEPVDPFADARLYHLRSSEQVIERCRSMLARCRSVALLDIFPEPLEDLRADVEGAAARGVRVALKTYRPLTVKKSLVAIAPDGAEVLGRWGGHWVNLVIDAKELLLAFLSPGRGEVRQALWSESAYLSWLYYNGLYSELTLAALEQHIKEGAGAPELRKVMAKYRRLAPPQAPTYQGLLRRLSESSETDG